MGKTERPHANSLCGAKTRAGTPCKNRAMPNGRCRMHGGKSTGVKKNKNAEKHGLFSKYLPEETMDLVNSMESLNTIDMLWDNIKIQYAAIIRAQKIMYVKDKEDDDKPTLNGEILRAGAKQSDFLQSQSRAMNTLSKMIKDYEDLCKTNIATEVQIQRLEQIKSNTEFTKERTKLLTGTKKDTSILEALIDLENEEDE
ncbi:MAG TPA: HGGxSTG domain-containing protein [Tissierellaceae bacterium]|nr:HGGxSTG domain-containing protein [Tissierellaceae bacterium]